MQQYTVKPVIISEAVSYARSTQIGTEIEYKSHKDMKNILAHLLFRRTKGMLETIIIILLVLWLLGMVSGQSLGGMLWMLLVVAAILFVVRLVTSRRTA